MAKKASGKTQSNNEVEAKVVALAEQLGWFLGTVRGKADGLLASDAVQQEVARIRDSAAELMEHVNRAGASAKQMATSAGTSAKKAVATVGKAAQKATKSATAPAPVVATATKRSGGTVDAPGKKHRKPPPQERLDKRMGEPVGKQLGQKSFQVGKSRGRG